MAHEAKVWVSHWPAAGGRFNGNWAGVSLAFCAVPGTQWGGGPGAPLKPRSPDWKRRPVQGGEGIFTACRQVGLQLKGQLLPPHCPGEQKTRRVTGWSLED